MPIRIEAATADDIPALIGLLNELFTIESDFVPDEAKQKRGLQLLLREQDRARVLVARDEHDRAIGMVTAQLAVSTAEGACSVWIEDMVVQGGHRRRGLGRALLDAALRWAADNGATRAQLLVDTGNDPALEYYSHLGWEETSLKARRWFIGKGPRRDTTHAS